MKNLLIILALTLFPTLHYAQNKPQKSEKEEEKAVMKPEKNDDGEWELTVIDTQYDYFLNAIAQPISQYSESYLKNRNTFLVTEWNSYFTSGRYRNIIESSIQYDPTEKYGIKFEYRLYQVFAYVQWKYGLKMTGLGVRESTRF
ncbi:hypothetical protein ASG31_15030 [Chryseobacterium sp. Leaf404]|uniref:DUF6146 family protein n=1 Tax=unclassified Chryseobacterium TaxID=2593645 RepID=UPI0006F4466F|nr:MULTISPECIES: DUF6146 family protein [unclassified Chryseobacterium]KQT15571.1 hypothetical protein ASG31_15030 [Chryseobacterium sp. Leaf404]